MAMGDSARRHTLFVNHQARSRSPRRCPRSGCRHHSRSRPVSSRQARTQRCGAHRPDRRGAESRARSRHSRGLRSHLRPPSPAPPSRRDVEQPESRLSRGRIVSHRPTPHCPAGPAPTEWPDLRGSRSTSNRHLPGDLLANGSNNPARVSKNLVPLMVRVGRSARGLPPFGPASALVRSSTPVRPPSSRRRSLTSSASSCGGSETTRSVVSLSRRWKATPISR
jgi:hypothetical protein